MPEPVPVQLWSRHPRPLPCPRQHPDGQECSSHTSCPRTCARIYSSWECKIKGLRRSEGLILVSATFQQQRQGGARPTHKAYFLAVSALAASALPASLLAYLRRKRSIRPAVSSNFCLPVKKGWQAEQISTLMSPRCAERVTNAFPQAQCTRTSV